MRKEQVAVGRYYWAKVSGAPVIVRIASESPYGGWYAISMRTGKSVRIRTAGRLKSPADAAPGGN